MPLAGELVADCHVGLMGGDPALDLKRRPAHRGSGFPAEVLFHLGRHVGKVRHGAAGGDERPVKRPVDRVGGDLFEPEGADRFQFAGVRGRGADGVGMGADVGPVAVERLGHGRQTALACEKASSALAYEPAKQGGRSNVEEAFAQWASLLGGL
jgi:hypothetical protein